MKTIPEMSSTLDMQDIIGKFAQELEGHNVDGFYLVVFGNDGTNNAKVMAVTSCRLKGFPRENIIEMAAAMLTQELVSPPIAETTYPARTQN